MDKYAVKALINQNEGDDARVSGLTRAAYGVAYTNEIGFVPPLGNPTIGYHPAPQSGLTFFGVDLGQQSASDFANIPGLSQQSFNRLFGYFKHVGCLQRVYCGDHTLRGMPALVHLETDTNYGAYPLVTAAEAGAIYDHAVDMVDNNVATWLMRNAGVDYNQLSSGLQSAITDYGFHVNGGYLNNDNSAIAKDLRNADWQGLADDLKATGDPRWVRDAAAINVDTSGVPGTDIPPSSPKQGQPC